MSRRRGATHHKYGSRYNPCILPRDLRPVRFSRRIEPFDSDQYIFELKIDGFRALAHIETGKGELRRLCRNFTDSAPYVLCSMLQQLIVPLL